MGDVDVSRIAALNDDARRTFVGCRVVITRGIDGLGGPAIVEILLKVQKFDQFTADNDPFEERDFGKICYMGNDIFWKIDYFDLDYSMHSPDPSDPTVTARVLTIMLAEEY
jgi:hypothetical protein